MIKADRSHLYGVAHIPDKKHHIKNYIFWDKYITWS
jgi:hypothetical protein